MSRISFFIIFTLLHIINIANCAISTDDVNFWGSTESISLLTYKESSGKYFEIHRSFNFGNDVVVHIIYPTNITSYCLENTMNFLYIDGVNGAITPFQVDFSFSAYNFCPGLNKQYSYDIYRLDSDKMLIRYVNSTDVNSASFSGLVVEKRGKVISNSFLARVPVRNGNLYPYSEVKLYYNEDNDPARFVFAYSETETQIAWINFEMDDKMVATQLSSGKYSQDDPIDQYDLLAGVDRNFAFVITSRHMNIPQTSITYIDPETNSTERPSVIFTTSIERIMIISSLCNIYTSSDYYCFFLTQEANNQSIAGRSFLRNGAVTSIMNPNVNFNNKEIRIGSFLYNHGFILNLLSAINQEKTLFNIEGLLLDGNGEYNGSSWPFPPNLTVSNKYQTVELDNGYFLLIDKTDSNLTIQSAKAEPVISYPYGIPDIVSTYPGIDEEIPLYLNNISITYNIPIILSEKNITIYENTIKGPLIRQIITEENSQDFVTYGNDNKTIIIQTLPTTFNTPNTSYYITISDNGLKDRGTSQPILGVQSKWKFNTVNSEITYKPSKNILCQFSLTPGGQTYFNGLNSYEQNIFLGRLRIQLASIIPINLNRFGFIDYFKGSLYTIKLYSTENPKEKSSESIKSDLSTLITHGNMTLISWFNTTKHIDYTYGFIVSNDVETLFKQNEIPLIVLSIIVVLCGLAYLYLRKRFPMGQNMVLFTFIIIVLSFIFDLLFILSVSKDSIPYIFVLSMVFFVLTLAINSSATTVIIVSEIKFNKNFNKWMKTNSVLAGAFTILAGVDVDALDFLSSNFAGIKILNAPFSEIARKRLKRMGIASIFYKDFPKFFVQILFYHATISYELIPFLSIAINFILLLNNIVAKLYITFVYKYEPTIELSQMKKVSDAMG